MPQKTVREMNKFERQHYSLAARVFHAVLNGSIILGTVALLIGLGLYTFAVVQQYILESFNLTRSTNAIMKEVVDTSDLSAEVLRRYHAMSEAERSDPDSAVYQAKFSDLTEREDYQMIRAILEHFLESSEVYDLYVAMYDRETGALVYIVDPEDDPEYACPTGYWEEVEKRELDKFLSWNGEGELYDISKTERYGWMCTAGIPLKNTSGEITGFVLSDITLDGLLYHMRNFVLQYAITMFVVVNIFAFVMVRHMKKTLVKPINSIAEAAENYVNDRKAGNTDTEHFSKLNIRTGDEVENLALVMADMERDLTDYEENLTKITAELFKDARE